MELITYLLKVSVCSALFFAFYLLVLRKLTFFKINRFYLLLSLLISFIIPALQFTIERESPAPAELVFAPSLTLVQGAGDEISRTPIEIDSIQATPIGSFNWLNILSVVYGLIVLGLFAVGIARLFRLLKHTSFPVKEINGLKLVAKGTGFTNCSFFNYVFVDESSLTDKELAVLLAHEQVHAQQYHSVDKLLLMLAKAVLWFNPIIYLYDKALEEAHEYEADETTSKSIGAESYATLLLNLAVSKSQNPLLHNFVKSPIKQRIKMLFNSKSKNMKKLIYLLALPMAMGLVWLLATEVVYANGEDNSLVDASFLQNKPFVERVKTKDAKGHPFERVTVNSPGKPLTTGIFNGRGEVAKTELVFFINSKLYTEAEVQKFKSSFVKGLSTAKGFGFAKDYDIPGVAQDVSTLVFWVGKEPKLSEYTAKNRAIFQKYNGKTVQGTVVAYSYSPGDAKLMDGFIMKTSDGVLLKAFVEPKFVRQANAMIKKGEQVTVKIYNATYWKDSAYPILSSFKLMKDDKVLFDRWPKVASNVIKTSAFTSVKNINFKEKKKEYEYSAQDSTVMDKENNTVHLYGKARLKNKQGEVFADEIHYNFKTNKGTVIGAKKQKAIN